MMRIASTPGRSGAIAQLRFKRIHADLLDLERDRIGARRQSPCRIHVVPLAHDGFVHNKARRALGFGIHDAHAITHGARGHGRHAPNCPPPRMASKSSRTNYRNCHWDLGKKRASPWQFLIKYFLGSRGTPIGQALIKGGICYGKNLRSQQAPHSPRPSCRLPACPQALPWASEQSRAASPCRSAP